jgi:hypothetical protein
MTLLFAKDADGMLHQVPQRDAEEEAARLATEERELALQEEASKIEKAREQAFKKLEKLGLSPDDIAAIMKP